MDIQKSLICMLSPILEHLNISAVFIFQNLYLFHYIHSGFILFFYLPHHVDSSILVP